MESSSCCKVSLETGVVLFLFAKPGRGLCFHWAPVYLYARFEMIVFFLSTCIWSHTFSDHQRGLWITHKEQWHLQTSDVAKRVQSKPREQPWPSPLTADLNQPHSSPRAMLSTHNSVISSPTNLLCLPTLSSFLLMLCLCVFLAGRFCVGDKFFLKNNMILCQMDYEEGQLNGSFETQVQ